MKTSDTSINSTAASMYPSTHASTKQFGLPRTLKKIALRRYFGVTQYTFKKYYITPEINRKMGILNSEMDRRIRTYNSRQTRILIEELQLTESEIQEIRSLV